MQPIDLAVLIYTGAATIAVLAFAGPDLAGWPWLLVAHALVVTLVVLAVRARRGGRVARFMGEWYAMVLLPGLYAEVGVINVAVGYDHDRAIQHLETLVFGSQISYRWIREMPNAALSWALHACYLAYYAILYAAPAALWASGRRDAAKRTILAVAASFFACYVVFLFFPVAGPRYAFAAAHNAATAVWPARAAQWILDRGDSWGAAFPSSHVAASVVATGMAWLSWRRLGLALVPFTTGLVLGVVYGQFHYAVDALAGLLVAGLVLAVMQRRVPAEAPSRASAMLLEPTA